MVRAAALILLLGGCEQLQPRHADVDTMVQVAKQGAEIERLRAEIKNLQAEQERDRAFSVSTYNDLNRMRDVLNKNVEVDNKRNDATNSRINLIRKSLYGE